MANLCSRSFLHRCLDKSFGRFGVCIYWNCTVTCNCNMHRFSHEARLISNEMYKIHALHQCAACTLRRCAKCNKQQHLPHLREMEVMLVGKTLAMYRCTQSNVGMQFNSHSISMETRCSHKIYVVCVPFLRLLMLFLLITFSWLTCSIYEIRYVIRNAIIPSSKIWMWVGAEVDG